MAHECPHCRHPVPRTRLFFTTVWGRWRCPSCGSLLGVDVRRRFMVLLVPGIGIGVLVGVVTASFITGYYTGLATLIASMVLVFLLLDRAVVHERCGLRCQGCGYDLRGQAESRCPECGKEFEQPVAPAIPRAQHPGRGRTLVVILLISLLGGTVALLAGTYMYFRTAQRKRAVVPALTVPAETDREWTDWLGKHMERIYRAATIYHRDFRRWPERVDELAGHSLPRDFTMSPSLVYQPLPDSESSASSWVLIVSDPVRYDRKGEPLPEPRRLILRLSGKVELLLADKVDRLLTAQGATSVTPRQP